MHIFPLILKCGPECNPTSQWQSYNKFRVWFSIRNYLASAFKESDEVADANALTSCKNAIVVVHHRGQDHVA